MTGRAAAPRAGLRVALAVLAMLAAALAGWELRPAAPPAASLLRPHDAAVRAHGERLYRQHCAACHGAQGEGQSDWQSRGADGLLPAPPHDASGHTWHHPDAQLLAIVRDGMAQVIGQPDYRSAMPAYAGTLSDADIVAVLSWIKSRWPPEVQAHHDQVNAQAAAAAPGR